MNLVQLTQSRTGILDSTAAVSHWISDSVPVHVLRFRMTVSVSVSSAAAAAASTQQDV